MAMLLLKDDDDDDNKEHKRVWVELRFQKGRLKARHYSQLLSDLAAHDTPGFQNFMRMDFEILKKQ